MPDVNDPVALAPRPAAASFVAEATRRLSAPLAAVCGAGLVWLLAKEHLPFFADDALISLRYADRLLSGHGLTFTTGEHVEGYSNLLWILVIAAGGLIHGNLIVSVRRRPS